MDNILGNRIKTLREEARLSQIDLAKVLHIGNTTISQYESGVRVPSDSIKIAIAQYFGVSLDYLMGETDERRKPPVVDGGLMAANTVRIAGRDGSYVEKKLSDEQVDLIRRMVEQLPDYTD